VDECKPLPTRSAAAYAAAAVGMDIMASGAIMAAM
jgi:hypothetical protein